ncbi:hypothetical protein [Actinoplanes sp. NPDC051494]|uniref:hypothetical protein n=1 Tax=Actinoplanes sp. NPDC051494 TaxID=3363907 RepID=UPI0037B6A100
MDGPGFHVDIDALDKASNGIAHTIDDQSKSQLADVCAARGAYGDDTVHAAMTDFCDRWNVGFDLLVEDARTVSDILGKAARAYRAVDGAAATRLTGDPGVAALDG